MGHRYAWWSKKAAIITIQIIMQVVAEFSEV